MLSVAGPVTTIAITLALVALVLSILKEHRMARNSELSVAAIGAAVVLGAGTLSSPGILAGVAVLVLGFDRRRPVLIGMAVAFLLVFGSVYYYSLTLTLLEKSGVLVGSGLLCLVVRRKLAPGSEEVAV